MRILRIWYVVFVIISSTCVLLLSSCSAQPTIPLRTILQTAVHHIDDASSLHMSFSTADEPPADIIATVSGSGSISRPNSFEGTFLVSVDGIPVNVSIAVIHGTSYIKVPLSQSYVKGSASQYGFPDPVSLFSSSVGFPSLLMATKNLSYGGIVVNGSTSDWAISGSIPDTLLSNLFDTPYVKNYIHITYDISTSTKTLSSITVIAPFFTSSTNSSFTITIDKYNEVVHMPSV